jgi:hypothetical protein
MTNSTNRVEIITSVQRRRRWPLVRVHVRLLAKTRFSRHSPDDSETSVESSDFAASLEARREMWLATSRSGSPNDGRGSDLAIFPGICTHSFCRLLLNA